MILNLYEHGFILFVANTDLTDEHGYYLLQIAQRTLIFLNTNITNNTNILGSNTDFTDEHGCYNLPQMTQRAQKVEKSMTTNKFWY